MTVKLLVLGALCAFLGSEWIKGGTALEAVVSCEAGVHQCPGAILGHASPDRMFGALAMR